MSTRDDTIPKKLKKIVEETISKETGGVLMTVAEQLIQKGELIGSIRTAQLMKGIPISDKKQLKEMTINELKNMLGKFSR